jgi:formylglycine-generating enzyme required for sulfatase activity
MHGNLLQWCEDLYGEYPKNDVVDPQGAKAGMNHIVRGGCWCSIPLGCRSAFRGTGVGSRVAVWGFRICFFVA